MPELLHEHQTADIGLAGGKVRVDGRVGLGYQLFLGADVDDGVVGEPVLRLLEDEVPGAVIALVETWTAVRRPHEPVGRAFRRIGLDTVAAALTARLRPAAHQDGDVFADPEPELEARAARPAEPEPEPEPEVVSVGG